MMHFFLCTEWFFFDKAPTVKVNYEFRMKGNQPTTTKNR